MYYFNQESERLKYRKLTDDYLEEWTNFFEHKEGLKYLGIDLNRTPHQMAKDWIDKQQSRYEEGLGHLAAIHKQTGKLIGVGGIIKRNLEGKMEYEVAYSILPDYWKQGYGTELAKQMRSYGFQNINTHRLISIIAKENKPSVKVALKNGMENLFETVFLGMNVYVYGLSKE